MRIDKFQARDILESGADVKIRTNMGSCQCEDTIGTLFIGNRGRLCVVSHGGAEWQKYDGLAEDCRLGYGFGATAREVAALVEQDRDENILYSFSSGTYLAWG